MVQIGIMIEGQDGLNWERWRRLLQTAEDCGYQFVFRSDHFTNASGDDKDSLELWTSLTYAATATQRIEFGSMVCPVTFRHPAMTVRCAAAVDDLSGGRLTLGLGAGWQEREHKKFGVPFYDFPTRYEMLTDALEMTRLLLESDQPVHFMGQHFVLEDALLLPRPARKTPLLIGGNGAKRTLPLVAQYADEWNAVFIDQGTYLERTDQLNALLDAQGRPRNAVKRSLMTQVIYDTDDARLGARLAGKDKTALLQRGLIIGTGSEVVDHIANWAALGVERFMLQWLDQDDIGRLESLARDVLPHFH